ncbi:MAG: ATP-binding protein [Candidatus Heimdallarchaeota archaeon]
MESFQRRMTRGDDFQALNSIIVNTLQAPFSSSTYSRDKGISFFVGREEEIKTILQVVQVVVSEGQSRGIALEGPGGCGKSTLFGYINQLLWQEAVETYVDVSSTYVISAFVLAPDNARSFRDLWRPIFEGLEEQNCSYFEKLACQIISKLLVVFHNHPEKFEELKGIIWGSSETAPHFRAQKYSEAISKHILQDFITNGLSKRIPELIAFVERNARQILRHHTTPLFKTPDTPDKFVLDRVSGIPRMQQLLGILGEDGQDRQNSFYLHDEELIKSDDEAIAWFNWIDQTVGWIFGKTPCFLIGIDDIGKISGVQATQDIYFQGFFNTLIRLRNALGRVAFVLIGTTDDWHRMNAFVNQNADLRSQVRGFLVERISLAPLDPDLAVQVFENRMDEFWNSQGRKPRTYTFYPFAPVAFRYLYEYKAHQIRDSLNVLHSIWQKARRDRRIRPLLDYFQAMKRVRTIENDWPDQFLPDALHLFERMAILKEFWDPATFSTEEERSAACGQALATVFQLVAEQDHPRWVDRARRNPIINVGENGQERRLHPGVFVEFFGQGDPARARTVDFQVKIFGRTGNVGAADLRSSFDLLEFGTTDLLYLMITGAGLGSQARMEINTFPNRVMELEPLTDDQLLSLVLLTRYKEITGAEIDLQTAKAILVDLLDRRLEQFAQELQRIPKNDPRSDTLVAETSEPLIPAPSAGGELSEFLESTMSAPARSDDSPAQAAILPQAGDSAREEPLATPVLEGADPESSQTALRDSEQDWGETFRLALKHWEKDIRYFFTRILMRKGRWKGQTTINYLIKDCPPDISPERLKTLFRTLSSETPYFRKEKTSIYITGEGEEFARKNSFVEAS